MGTPHVHQSMCSFKKKKKSRRLRMLGEAPNKTQLSRHKALASVCVFISGTLRNGERRRQEREKRYPSTGGKKSWRLSRWEEIQSKGGKEGGPGSSMVTAKGGNVCDGGGGRQTGRG